MITDRDREIINYVYQIGFATIDQISAMFFFNSKVAYDLARRRLKKIKDSSDYLKTVFNQETRQIIYLPQKSNKKRVSLHDIKVIDYLCELKKLGCNIENIFIEPEFADVIPDALVQFTFDNCRYYQLIEMQLRHDFVNVDRYNDIIPNLLSQTNNVLPNLIIIQDTNRDYVKDNNCELDIIQLKLDMDDIAKVLC